MISEVYLWRSKDEATTRAKYKKENFPLENFQKSYEANTNSNKMR